MKKTKFAIIYLVSWLIPLELGAQTWQSLPTNFAISLKDIYAKDADNIIMVGNKGEIVLSNDGGNHYNRVQSGTNKQLTSVSCTNSNCFVLAGDEILVSSDNQIWSKYTLPSYGGNNIYFYNDQIGYISGAAQGEILKSVNGGLIWEVIKTNMPEHYIKSVFFVSEQEGFAITQDKDIVTDKPSGIILKTMDGGHTWMVLHSKKDYFFNELYFTNPNTGYVVGVNGILLKTDDGGNSWNVIHTNTIENLRSIEFIGDNVGFIAGTKGTVLKTSNQGATWTKLDTGKPHLFVSLSMVDVNKIFLLVESHVMIKTITGGI